MAVVSCSKQHLAPKIKKKRCTVRAGHLFKVWQGWLSWFSRFVRPPLKNYWEESQLQRGVEVEFWHYLHSLSGIPFRQRLTDLEVKETCQFYSKEEVKERERVCLSAFLFRSRRDGVGNTNGTKGFYQSSRWCGVPVNYHVYSTCGTKSGNPLMTMLMS